MLALDRKCGQCVFSGQEQFQFRGKWKSPSISLWGGAAASMGRAFLHDAGFWARVYLTWLCLVKGLGLAHTKVFLADISCPSCFLFHRSIFPVRLALWGSRPCQGSPPSLSHCLSSYLSSYIVRPCLKSFSLKKVIKRKNEQ